MKFHVDCNPTLYDREDGEKGRVMVSDGKEYLAWTHCNETDKYPLKKSFEWPLAMHLCDKEDGLADNPTRRSLASGNR